MINTARKRLVQKYYSIRAKDYDRQKSRTWKSDHGLGTEVLNEVLDAFEGFEDKVSLDVGVGSGRNAKPLLEKVRPSLVGLDLTKEMLEVARNKMAPCKQYLNLILGDAEHLPFVAGTFDAILCVSTMHYFTHQKKIVKEFARLLKKNGMFVYGDLSPHESDNKEFFEKLERTISKAHARYYKASEMKELLEAHGFCTSRIKTVAYAKSYSSLIEDKARYFGAKPETLQRYLKTASKETRQQYALTNDAINLFYTVIVATRRTQTP